MVSRVADDLAAIISYLRAQPPVRNLVPADEWTLMGSRLGDTVRTRNRALAGHGVVFERVG